MLITSFGSINASENKKAITLPSLKELNNPEWFSYQVSPNGHKTVFFITPEGHKHFAKGADGREGKQYDEYYFELSNNGTLIAVEAHDYNRIYEEGAWKYQFILKCLDYQTPRVTAENFLSILKANGMDSSHIRLLDMAAGSGMAVEELRAKGFKGKIIGQDVVPNAKQSASHLYEDYVVAKLSEADNHALAPINDFAPNALMISSGLEYSKVVSPHDLVEALELISLEEGKAPFAFSVNSEISNELEHPINNTIQLLVANNVIDIKHKEEYMHRRNLKGEPLNYYGVTGLINKPVSDELKVKIDQLDKAYKAL